MIPSPDKAERRDLADERDNKEYFDMLHTVEMEMTGAGGPDEFKEPHPGMIAIHNEAMRRLKAKYESACGE